MYFLDMNPVGSEPDEHILVGRAETRADLEAVIGRELVEPYDDNGVTKVFRKGGILENFNPPPYLFKHIYNVGDEESYVEKAKAEWRKMMDEVPDLMFEISVESVVDEDTRVVE